VRRVLERGQTASGPARARLPAEYTARFSVVVNAVDDGVMTIVPPPV
jgi:hypothetical protein